MPTTMPATHKETATDFLKLAASGRAREAFERYASLAAVAHFFRFEGDRIVELRDVGQEVPADSPNNNGMF